MAGYTLQQLLNPNASGINISSLDQQINNAGTIVGDAAGLGFGTTADLQAAMAASPGGYVDAQGNTTPWNQIQSQTGAQLDLGNGWAVQPGAGLDQAQGAAYTLFGPNNATRAVYGNNGNFRVGSQGTNNLGNPNGDAFTNIGLAAIIALSAGAASGAIGGAAGGTAGGTAAATPDAFASISPDAVDSFPTVDSSGGLFSTSISPDAVGSFPSGTSSFSDIGNTISNAYNTVTNNPLYQAYNYGSKAYNLVSGLSGSGGGNSVTTPSDSSGGINLGSLIQGGLGVAGGITGIGEAKTIGNQAAGIADPYMPYRAGNAAELNGLIQNPSSVFQNPIYQAQFAQGTDAVNRGLAAQGLTASGNQEIALQNYGESTASNYYQTILGDLEQTSGESKQNMGLSAGYVAGIPGATAAAGAGLGSGVTQLLNGLGLGGSTVGGLGSLWSSLTGGASGTDMTGFYNSSPIGSDPFSSLGTGSTTLSDSTIQSSLPLFSSSDTSLTDILGNF